MLDDRLRSLHPDVASLSVASEDFPATCWGALLDGSRENEGGLAVAAPARQPDLSRLAPAYVEVGDLDNFRDEDIAYALRLAQAGVPVELHVHPGAPHAFDLLAPEAQVSRRAPGRSLPGAAVFVNARSYPHLYLTPPTTVRKPQRLLGML